MRPQRIKGYVTRLVTPEENAPGVVTPERIFFQPEAGTDFRELDGKHRRASGELVVEASHEGWHLNDAIEVELSGEDDPLERTLTVVRRA